MTLSFIHEQASLTTIGCIGLLIAILILPVWSQEKDPTPLGPGGPCLFGDINQDGQVSLTDLSPFQSLLINDCQYLCEADFDQDGLVNLLDYAEFLKLLKGG